jgi:Ca2+-binding EF-hand superfamily protein
LVEVTDVEAQTQLKYCGGECQAEAAEPKKESQPLSPLVRGLLKKSVKDVLKTTETHMVSMTDFLKDILTIKLKSELLNFETQLMDTLQQPEASSPVNMHVLTKKAAELMNELKKVRTTQKMQIIEVTTETNQDEILNSFYDAITKVLERIPKHTKTASPFIRVEEQEDKEESEEDEDEEEDREDEEEDREDGPGQEHVQAGSKKQRPSNTTFSEFKLGRNRIAGKISSLKDLQHSITSHGLMQKVLNTPVHKLKNVMIKKMLLKLIGSLYEEKLRDANPFKLNDMRTFVYNSLKNKYGLDKVAETKFRQIVSSCIKFKSVFRIKNFGRFFGLYEPFERDDLETYLRTLDSVQKLLGRDWHPAYQEEVVWVPLASAVEAVAAASFDNLPQSYMEHIKLRLEDMKSFDMKTKAYNVQLELFLMVVVDSRNCFKVSAENFTRAIFDAADINGDGYISTDELNFVLKCIAMRPFEDQEVRRIFKENADITLTNSEGEFKALTFENFALVSRKYQMFSTESRDRFLGVTSALGVTSQLEDIQANLKANISQMEWRHTLSPQYEVNEAEISSRLKSLKKKILLNDNPEMLLLAYRFNDFESKLVAVDFEIESLLPTLKAISIPFVFPKSPRRLQLD